MDEIELESEIAARLRDYDRDPSYEERLVIFYDFLGWRHQIQSAGEDPKSLGNLRRAILTQVRMRQGRESERVSTFSDNIVVSKKVDKLLWASLVQVALVQLGTARDGFWLRGGITIGNIVHDREVVFGPALNRAYHLESKVARFPRLVVDENVLTCLDYRPSFLVEEDGIHFLDPFDERFLDAVLDLDSIIAEYPSLAHLPQKAFKDFRNRGLPIDWDEVPQTGAGRLRVILKQLQRQIIQPLDDEAREKLAWLHDRIAKRLGAPLSDSFPRCR